MRRRDLLSLGTLALAGSAATAAAASTSSGSDAPASGAGTIRMNIGGVGLPIVADGRIRNYIFVTVALTLGSGKTPEQMRAKEPYFRDALTRAGHRTPFVLANDWTQIDTAAVCAAMMRVAPAISGPGSVTAAEVVLQMPRRRTGVGPA